MSSADRTRLLLAVLANYAGHRRAVGRFKKKRKYEYLQMIKNYDR